MSSSDQNKDAILREHGCLHPHPQRVTDALFQDSEFFDPRDLVLVKYEMLRRVHIESCSVTEAARRFGFSRPAFYQIQESWQQHGMPGLISKRPGPRSAHKLNDEVLAVIDGLLTEDPELSSASLAARLLDQRELVVHPRSIERALARRKKRGALKTETRRELSSHLPGPMWNNRYESLRAAWLASTAGWGQSLFSRQGSVAWMKAWPIEDAARADHSQEVISPGELTNELEREVTDELVNIILHQQHHSQQEVASDYERSITQSYRRSSWA